MALPKIEHPIFDLILPASKTKIRYRPFLVKEEKILLIALQGEDSEEIITAIKQVLNNCIVTEGIDIDTLPTIDLEYLFIKVRARSVNNVIKLTYKDLEDEKRYDVEVNLDEVEVKFDENHSNIIRISDSLTLKMKYPQVDIANKLKESKTEAELLFDILRNCIESISDGENEYRASDSSVEELDEFIQNLDVKAFNEVQKFFTSMPRLYHEVKYTNSLGNERTVKFNSLSDFFTLG